MEPQKEMSIEMTPEIAEGVYANFAVISHSQSEFVLDYVCILPGMAKAQVKSRIILTPEHAKRLLGALQDNVTKYEAGHGKIKLSEAAVALPMSMGSTAAQA